MLTWLSAEISFPPPDTALAEPAGANGLLAAGGDLSPDRLLAAYAQGIFPWYAEGQPILWWSPDPRMVLLPDALKISRSLQKTLRNQAYSVRLDTAFAQTMTACATQSRPGQGGTWINQDMLSAYQQLHAMGYAHSVETWMDNTLVGGLYGMALGGVFYGESMFHRATDASKIAFVHLIQHLQQNNYGMMDCQMKTAHLASLGARELSRSEFSLTLMKLVNYPLTPGKW